MIVHRGLGKFYVVDFRVTETTEQMFHIRTLNEFLKEKSPEFLKKLQEDIASETEIAE